MECKEAIPEHQEAVHGIPRSFNIPRIFYEITVNLMEYQVALMEYQGASIEYQETFTEWKEALKKYQETFME